jgi:hypothetical protein
VPAEFGKQGIAPQFGCFFRGTGSEVDLGDVRVQIAPPTLAPRRRGQWWHGSRPGASLGVKHRRRHLPRTRVHNGQVEPRYASVVELYDPINTLKPVGEDL